jgi:hypothetical protein
MEIVNYPFVFSQARYSSVSEKNEQYIIKVTVCEHYNHLHLYPLCMSIKFVVRPWGSDWDY